MDLSATKRKAWCTCPRGDVFLVQYVVAVNIDDTPKDLETLVEGGTQLVRCPICGAVWPLAEPIVVDNPRRKRLAVFVPELLAHRCLEIRADISGKIAAGDPGEIPSYFAQFQIVVGVSALEAWLAERDEDNDEADPVPSVMSLVPRIHEAFADLNEPERVSTSSIPPVDSGSHDTKEQDLLPDDDWLQDDRITAPPSEGRKGTFKRTTDSGSTEDVDFVDMMSVANDDDHDDDVDGG